MTTVHVRRSKNGVLIDEQTIEVKVKKVSKDANKESRKRKSNKKTDKVALESESKKD